MSDKKPSDQQPPAQPQEAIVGSGGEFREGVKIMNVVSVPQNDPPSAAVVAPNTPAAPTASAPQTPPSGTATDGT